MTKAEQARRVLLKPRSLPPDGTIGIVAPSSPVLPEVEAQFGAGIRRLEGMGFRVRVGSHVRDRHFYSAGTAADRAADINDLWADDSVDMILMAQGGQTANGLLDLLDYELFREIPKIFAGISDGTTLLNAIASRSNIVTFHGPDLMWVFGREMTSTFIDHFRKMVVEGWSGSLPSPTFRVVREGEASGPLWGGHSNILIATMFAGYGPDFDGAILFLEGTHVVAELDRQFQALRLSGVFDRIAGLVLGHFDNCQPEDSSLGRPLAEMVLEVTAGYSFPIVELQELGHNVENFVFPLGVRATISSALLQLRFDEPAVSLP